MRTCMATVSLGGTLEDKIDGIAAAGFDGVEILDADLLASSSSAVDIARRCGDAGLSIDLYQPFRRAEGLSSKEFSEVVQRFHRELDVMADLGADAILVVSNTDDDALADLDTSAAQLAALGDAATEHGVTVMFEALAWGTHINHVSDVIDVLTRADHPALSLVVDTFHLYAGGEGMDVVTEIDLGSVGFVQIADAPWMSMDLLEWSRNHRCFPGEGDFSLVHPVGSLIDTGYDGPISLEIFNPRYRELPPGDMARRGADALSILIEQLDARPAEVHSA